LVELGLTTRDSTKTGHVLVIYMSMFRDVPNFHSFAPHSLKPLEKADSNIGMDGLWNERTRVPVDTSEGAASSCHVNNPHLPRFPTRPSAVPIGDRITILNNIDIRPNRPQPKDTSNLSNEGKLWPFPSKPS